MGRCEVKERHNGREQKYPGVIATVAHPLRHRWSGKLERSTNSPTRKSRPRSVAVVLSETTAAAAEVKTTGAARSHVYKRIGGGGGGVQKHSHTHAQVRKRPTVSVNSGDADKRTNVRWPSFALRPCTFNTRTWRSTFLHCRHVWHKSEEEWCAASSTARPMLKMDEKFLGQVGEKSTRYLTFDAWKNSLIADWLGVFTIR